ncbi:type II toxin-antitoxin system VapC family toxin [Sphingomonas sp. PAMC 26617]|uniref:type II toxin-antitoxin system VapC family toxin n=1 Tax=Sphingomonas sp. PAMC 26617 TaxID=1112216 RepID=UPI00028A19C1|nr:type II toxin-antitoxin system VapC family toxin [Sphingomonas sp. PAMC 26617]
MIVVDASLAVRALLREPDTDQALRFLERNADQLVAPDLLLTEVCGAIVRAVNSRSMRQDEGLIVIREWTAAIRDRLVFLYRLTPDRLEAASTLAITLGHPVADCLYMALALELGADLATCDIKFHQRVRSDYPQVRLLEDF